MKKIVLIFLMTGINLFFSCESYKCNIPEDDNYQSKTEVCNLDSTLNKFIGTWTGAPGPYLFTVSKGTNNEYKLNVITNMGLTNGQGIQRDPVQLNNWLVTQDKASLATTAFYEGEITATLTYTSPIIMGIDYTLSGFGIPYDGTYEEILTK
ncbi:MAG: hypothetical protein N2167_06505 [Flavobacteriales bacterium]|nr:hypothetical protein [Flavobacteriales bacterium]